MKKIRNIKQLKQEQERLAHRQRELEREMQESWRKIKKNARPQQVAKEFFSEWIFNRLTSHGVGRLLRLFN